jgi:hypothetical protein
VKAAWEAEVKHDFFAYGHAIQTYVCNADELEDLKFGCQYAFSVSVLRVFTGIFITCHIIIIIMMAVIFSFTLLDSQFH